MELFSGLRALVARSRTVLDVSVAVPEVGILKGKGACHKGW